MRNKFRPYVRRANGWEKAGSLRIAVRLAFYQSRNRPFYVMVQRGFPNLAMDCGASKRDVARTPLMVASGRQKFRAWARRIQRYAQGAKWYE